MSTKIRDLKCIECGAVLLCTRAGGDDWVKAGWRYQYIVEPYDPDAAKLNGWYCHRCNEPMAALEESFGATHH